MKKQNLSVNKTALTKIMSTRQWIIVFFGLLICASLFLHAIVTVRVQAASRTISGRVFQDFNGNGTYDTTQTLANSSGTGTIGLAVDRGVSGVTVTAYDTTGAAQPVATTAANGTYTITTNSGSVGPYRIEFTNLPAGYYPSARSTDSVNGGTSTNAGTTVQFISDANTTNVNLAINKPVDYSEGNPLLATSLYNFGHRNDTGSTNVLPSFPYTAGSNSTSSATGYISPAQNIEATKAQIGSVFGLAYRSSSDTLYAATYMKRHTGIGPSGTGAIYQIPNVSNTTAGTPSIFTAIPNAGNDTHPTVSGAGVPWENDYNTFDAIGKIGLGGLDISDDGNSLFTVNLNTRELYQIPVSSGMPLSRGVVPNPGCTNGVGRPFAVKYFNGLVYVGGVCTAENAGGVAANLSAYVYTYNPSTNTYSASPVLSFSLAYTRGCVDDAQPCHNGEENAEWRPWISTVNFDTVDADNDSQVAYPQAMLTDIDFIGTDMVLAFRDRIGDQGGNGTRNPQNTSDITDYVTNTAGDVLRAHQSGANTWSLESNGQSNPAGFFGPSTSGQNNGEGPGNGEFYYGEDHPWHDEVVNGGIAYFGGFPDVVVTAMDPARLSGATWDGGTRWLSNANGSYTKGYIIYDGQRLDNLFGKAGGVGEVEGMSRRAPIELGSRVWRDSDNDGVQDPVNGTTEPGIQNVTVRLYRPGFGPDGVAGNGDDNTALATAVTDANGEYYFTSGTAADGNTGDNIGIYNGNILSFTAYEIRVDNNANFQSGGALFVGSAALNLTAPNTVTAQSGDDDASDSDGLYDPNTNCSATNNRCPTISFTTGTAGANNHTLDFGFTTGTTYIPTSTVYSVGNRVWFDTDNDNVRDTSGTAEVGVANVSVSIFVDTDNNGIPDDIKSPLQTVWTNTNGYYRFDGLLTGNYVVRVDPQNFEVGNVLAGYQNTTGTEADPDSNGDNNDNGINPANPNNPQTSVNGILSGALSLGTGGQPTGETDLGPGDSGLTDNLVDLSVDFAFYRLNLSGTTWRDNNNNGLITAGELGVRGIRIRVYDSAGTTELPIGPDGLLGTSDDSPGGIATNMAGDYAVLGLIAGNYVVKATLPSGATSSTGTGYEPGPNPNNEVDSDDNGTNGSGANAGLMVSMAKTMTPGGQTVVVNATGTTSNPTVDFGIIFAPSAVELMEFKAYQEGNRVLLTWESGFEVDNLGYNIIRESNGKREVVNSSMIAGSALQVGQGTALTAGNFYKWSEELSPKDMESGVQYWLEAVDINGTSEAHGPFMPERGMPESDVAERTRTLSELGRDVSNLQSQREYPAFLSPQIESVKPDNRSSKAASSKQKNNWTVAKQTAAKITVRSDGWYRVTREQLIATGFNFYMDSYRWQLFANGKEKAMKINQDGSIEFYGQALDTRSTDGQVYWLFVGASQGLRIAESSLDGTGEYPSTFMQTVERRDRVIRFSAILNGETDNFFGPPINTSADVNQTLIINKLDYQIGGTVGIEVGLQGMTLQEHLVEVRLNGEILGMIDYSGRERTSTMFNLPVSSLLDGDNVVSLISRNAGSDVSLLDFIRATYPRKAEAVDDYLQFSTNARQGISVGGFRTDSLRVIDITNPSAPIEISVNPTRGGNGYGFSLRPTAESRRFLAFVTGQEKAATEISTNYLSDLKNTRNKADFLIITHRNFMNAANLLRERRLSQGLNTLVVDVEDIYDEFDYGTHGARAIQEFLNYALTKWNVKPAYILLLGDASYDPRNYTTVGGPAADLVPTYMIDTDFMEAASDELLADVNGDGVAEASIGRLPVRNEDEAALVVNKLLNYEKPSSGKRNGRAGVIVSDFANDIDFVGENKQTALQLPTDMKTEYINRNDGDVNDVRERLRATLNAGPTVVNFMGHGTLASWTSASLLRSTEAMTLQNGENLSLVVMMSCLNGSFGEIGVDSMAESWMKAPNGGAIAVWASSGMSAPDQQALLNRYFYQSLFSSRNAMFGDAARAAKLSVNDLNVRRTWIFLGDPTMQLK